MNKVIFVCVIVLVTFAGVFCVTGCSSADNTTSVSERITEEKTESPKAQEGKIIKLTDNYSYKVPVGFIEAEEIFDDTVSETNCFATPDMAKQIRSWVYDGDFLFPDDVEAMNENGNVQIGYASLYDTAIAKVTDTIEEDGTIIYRTLYIWPDGADHLCFIDLASFDQDYSDFEQEIRESIRNSNAATGTGVYGFYGDYTGTPTDEEIENAMTQDIQEAIEEDRRKQEESHWHVFPYF